MCLIAFFAIPAGALAFKLLSNFGVNRIRALLAIDACILGPTSLVMGVAIPDAPYNPLKTFFTVGGVLICLLALAMLAPEKPRLTGRNTSRYPMIFVIAAIVTGFLAFSGIAGSASIIAWSLFVAFLILFLISSQPSLVRRAKKLVEDVLDHGFVGVAVRIFLATLIPAAFATEAIEHTKGLVQAGCVMLVLTMIASGAVCLVAGVIMVVTDWKYDDQQDQHTR